MGDGQLISVHPEELTFEVELEKPAYCNLKVINNSEHHVAFKSPFKPKRSSHHMQCKDKFLLQSTKVPPSIDFDEMPPDTFIKDDEKVIEECKLRVVYVTPRSGNAESEGNSGITSATRGSDMFKTPAAEEMNGSNLVLYLANILSLVVSSYGIPCISQQKYMKEKFEKEISSLEYT